MLTATKQAKKGYYIESIKKQVFSIEEINYFLYHHIDLVYRDFFSEELFDYIDRELEQPAMAGELRNLAENGGKTSDFIRYILNASYYYNNRELSEIAMYVADIDTMTRFERLKIRGDSFYKEGKANSALKCYLEILNGIGTQDLSNSFYARVAYAVGIIYTELFMTKSANAFFSYAYDLSPDPVYAKACVYMSLITGDDEELLSAIVKFKISDDSLDSMKNRVNASIHEIRSSDEMRAFSGNLDSKEYARELVEQWKEAYYKMLQ